MEPVTHILTGACLARTGLNRRAAYTTAAMALAAEFPDIDTLWGFKGSVSGFEHHRGITHTFLGLPFEAAIVTLLFWLFHRWRLRRASPGPDAPQGANGSSPRRRSAPVRWGTLYGFTLVALLSHILLDYTNNYGVRPFFPFNPHWYAASIVFIFDPLLFLVLLAGLLFPALFAMVGQEIGAKREAFRGAGWARCAVVCVVALWAFRAHEHGIAVALANQDILRAPVAEAAPVEAATDKTSTDSTTAAPLVRPTLVPVQSIASPDPLSVFRWYTATDFGPAYRLGTADTRVGALSEGEILNKPALTPALRTAEGSRLGQIYLDWSVMPWVSPAATSGQGTAGAQTTYTFEDVRFMGSTPLLHREGTVPLSGVVVLDASGQVLAQGMDGHFER